MAERRRYDVFLSYSGKDREEVAALAARLVDEARLKVFFDDWEIPAGDVFQDALEKALQDSGACAVLVGAAVTAAEQGPEDGGAKGLSPWQKEEVRAALGASVEEKSIRVIPVLLPSAKGSEREIKKKVPAFVGNRSWIDFRTAQGLKDRDAFGRLVAGIAGRAPGRPGEQPPSWLSLLAPPELRHPTGIAVDGETLLVAEHESGLILRLDGERVVATGPQLSQPHHLLVRGDGTIIATDTLNHRIVGLDASLKLLWAKEEYAGRRLLRPHGLASNHPRNYYLLDSDNNRLLAIVGDDVKAEIGGEGAGPGQFSIPCGVGVGLHSVYVADTYNHRIQVFTGDLKSRGQFGSEGGGSGQFRYPVGVARLYDWIVVADEHNKRLQLWSLKESEDPVGAKCVKEDVCGPWLGSPFGLAFNESRLYVADRIRGRVLVIDFKALLRAEGLALR